MSGLAAEEKIEVAIEGGAGLVIRRHANPGRPRLLLSHGNGFAIDGYRALWSLFADDFELVLFDQRNHGRNPLGPIETHSVAAMAGDHLTVQKAIVEAWGPRFTTGLFHSVSSIASIRASRDHQAQWDALVLFDPPLIAPEGNALRAKGQRIDEILSDFARNRPHHFTDPSEQAAIYRTQIGREWVEGADLDMARAVTRPAADGGYDLCCPGEYEARIYYDNAHFESYQALSSLRQPTLIIGADPEHGRPMPPALVGPVAAREHGIPHIIVPGTGHMLQVEKPDIIAEHVRTFVAAQSSS
ncbi:MAG: alpha/beta hydrolase [Hyphomicrobiales bacterium]|nr:alpha/beta hydrolase [Hyphomicrobiales bacterium]